MVDKHGFPRILVIARSDAHHAWKEALEGEAHYLAPNGAVYGARFDLIMIDEDIVNNVRDQQKHQTYRWLEEAIECRLSPRGKMVWFR